MNNPAPKVFFTSGESIPRLERVVWAVTEAAKRCGGLAPKVLPSALLAGCVHCGARISGEELVRLAGFSGPQESPRLRRLRTGRCVSPGCPSHEYKLIFRNHPDIDWVKLLSTALAERTEDDSDDEPPDAIVHDPERFRRWKRRIRVTLLTMVVLFLLLARQVYNGGRIPLVREPQKFRVDPAPHGQGIPR